MEELMLIPKTQVQSSPKRTKGERTKQLILESAIKILATEGIKGTTHRAIAKEANIQLSLTTYYFKDIEDLIHQAIELNSSYSISVVEQSWIEAFSVLNKFTKTQLKQKAIKEKLAVQLSELAAQYIYQKIVNDRNSIVVEQILFTCFQGKLNLTSLAQKHREALISPFVTICSFFNKNEPVIDAEILLAVTLDLKYRFLPYESKDIPLDDIYVSILRIVNLILRITKS
jgi:DNA-binding transcriptional regulator YbjK